MSVRFERPARSGRFPAGERGLTLVEAVVAALLTALVIVAVLGLYGRAVLYWKRGEAVADLEDHLRISLNTLGSDLRNARSVNWRTGPPARIPAGAATVDLFDLVVPKRTAPWETETVRYSWRASGTGDTRNVLRREVGTAGPQPIAHQITGIEVDLDPGSGTGAGGLVTVTLRAEKLCRGQPVLVEAAGRFQMRVAE